MNTALVATGGFVAGVLASLIAGLIVLAIERSGTKRHHTDAETREGEDE